MKQNFPKTNEDDAQLYDFREVGFKQNVVVANVHNANALPPLICHKHDNAFEITIYDAGTQLIVVDGQEYWTKGGDVLIVFPGETHSTGDKPKTSGSAHWLEFECLSDTNNFFNLPEEENRALQERMLNMPHRLFTCGAELRHSLNMLENICSKPITPLWKTEVRSLLLQYIFAIIRNSESGTARDSITKPISKVMQYIQDNLCDLSPQVPELAAMTGLSDSRFKTRFLKEVGSSPVSYINTLKVEKAKTMLCEPGRSIQDVALRLGYGSSQYFATVFKRITAVTPTQWIEKHASISS